MSALQACYQVTEELVKLLDTVMVINREETIEKVQELLDKREKLVELVKPPFTDEELIKGKELVEINKTLNSLLNNTKNNIQKDINGLSNRKMSMNKYVNPYQNMQSDAFFYDKRK